ncbi:MAG: hypothetical protein M3Y07_06535 [Acidobacteriota bacterium]|nr:hypothetical protein [Acidobacteriota bacterium]
MDKRAALYTEPQNFQIVTRDVLGQAIFPDPEVNRRLTDLALPGNSQLSVLAVEMLPGGDESRSPTRSGSNWDKKEYCGRRR